MAIKTQFLGGAGLLQVFGDARSNSIVISRDADGTLRVNGKTIVENGVTATVNNTLLISVFGDAGNDRITLDESNGPLPKANLFGGAGNDIITGGSGADQLFGEAGNDVLEGKAGDDLLFGGDGNDVLTGGAGSDQMFGAGDDRMIWNPGDGSDLADGGDGTDTLEVNGGNGAEVFSIAANGTGVRVDRINPAPFSIDANGIEEIVIKGNGGDDVFSATGDLAELTHLTLDGGDGNDTILGGNGDDLLLGGNGNDFIDGQQGSDTVHLGAGDDVFKWDPGDGSDMVEGEAGFDTLVFNGSNGTENFGISASGKRVVLTRDLGNITMDLNGIERIELNALGNNDTITIDDLTGTAVKEVAINLGDVGGNPDQEFDMVAINGTDKNDKINITANGSSIVITGLAAAVTITGAENTPDSSDAIVLMAGKGNDTIDASTLPAGMIHLVIDGGAGNDTINGGAGGDVLHGGTGNDKVDGGGGNDLAFLGEGNDVFTWNPGDGSDEVIGGDGVDVLDFVGSAQNEKITISATIGGDVQFLLDVGTVTMSLMEIERIEFDALAGTDEIVVNDLTGTTVKDVVIDLGPADGVADSITVNGTDGADHISVVSSGNSVLVNGLAADVTIKHSEGGLDTLIINGLGGNDTIDASGLKPGLINLVINGGQGDDVITGSRSNDVIIGGAGTDIMRGGAGDDTFVWNPGDGSDVIDGQSGNDTLAFNGSNAVEVFNISALDDGDVRLSRDAGNVVTQDLDGVETIELNALGGGDTIVIGDLTGTDVKDVHVTLAATAEGDEAADTVVINGTEGDDVITLSIENGSLVVNGLAGKIVIDNFDPEHDKIQIAGLGGDDIIDASAIAGLAPQLMLEGGDGNDILLGGAGNDVLLGGNGDDVLLGGAGIDIVDGEGGDDIEIQDLSAFAQLQEDLATAAFQSWIESAAVKDLHLL